jgi:hypothetical protein
MVADTRSLAKGIVYNKQQYYKLRASGKKQTLQRKVDNTQSTSIAGIHSEVENIQSTVHSMEIVFKT